MKHLLMIEPDRMINRAWSAALARAGFEVFPCFTFGEARVLLAARTFDAAIVDVDLPDSRELDPLFSELISRVPAAATLVLTAGSDEALAVHVLGTLHADFARKPLGVRELVARLTRDQTVAEKKASPPVVCSDDLVLVTETRQALFRGDALNLSPREYEVLRLLATNLGHPVSREHMLEQMGSAESLFDRTVDTHVSRLRKKLKDSGVTSVKIASAWGEGYLLKKVA